MNLRYVLPLLAYRCIRRTIRRFIIMVIKLMLKVCGPGDHVHWCRGDRAWPAATAATGPSRLGWTIRRPMQINHLLPVPRLLDRARGLVKVWQWARLTLTRMLTHALARGLAYP